MKVIFQSLDIHSRTFLLILYLPRIKAYLTFLIRADRHRKWERSFHRIRVSLFSNRLHLHHLTNIKLNLIEKINHRKAIKGDLNWGTISYLPEDRLTIDREKFQLWVLQSQLHSYLNLFQTVAEILMPIKAINQLHHPNPRDKTQPKIMIN